MEDLLDSLDDEDKEDHDDSVRSPSPVVPPPAKKPRSKQTAKATKKKVQYMHAHAC